MRLLEIRLSGDFVLSNFPDDAPPPYAILSHTWGDESQEVTYDDVIKGSGQEKEGYEKIRFCGEQARLDGLRYFWIDTCCINKANHAELSQAISSMFRWYRRASQCYVYLSDVSFSAGEEYNAQSWDSDFAKSRWFTRGWTLQELVAPLSVVFFSRERKRLGDNGSLKRQIHNITRLPMPVLEGVPLSQFSVEERFLWIKHRQTKLEEDMVYSLLGIFDVEIPLFYGEGAAAAFNRLRDIIDKRAKCIQDLHLTDPRKDKARIEESKGGLLAASYNWILEHHDFKLWRNDEQRRLLWIKGDPGKGKTMLLCGIVDELSKPSAGTHLSYFFCQATDSRINNAMAVLRGLLYLFISEQPSLVSHIQKEHDHAGKNLFEDANAWTTVSEIFMNVLNDPSLQGAYLVVDGLDECMEDLPKLLDFIVQAASANSRVKWLVSSRNEANIERKLQFDESGMRLSLELKENAEQVSHAVNAYIDRCLFDLTEIQYDKALQDSVREKMRYKANGTFLWVSLVVKELKEAMSWEVLQILDEFPTELKEVYGRMMDHIKRLQRKYPEFCRRVIMVVVAAYRPLHLSELHALSSLPSQVQDVNRFTTTIVRMCGSFLTIKDDTVYIIHQSAKDFLRDAAIHDVFPCGVGGAHYTLFSNSLQIMSRTLRRDMYGLCKPGYSIEDVQQPELDPLVASRYCCIYWIDHLHDWSLDADRMVELQDGGSVDVFIRKKFLYWLEALSLCKSIPRGIVSISKLEALINEVAHAPALSKLIQDARRFVMFFKWAIQNIPLQVYMSALLFCQSNSEIRRAFKHEEPENIVIRPTVASNWSACLQTLEGHSGAVNLVAFSHDFTKLASASSDYTVKIWDASSGECLQTLYGHGGSVDSVAFSHDSTMVASASEDLTAKIWDPSSGECLQTFMGHQGWVSSVVFFHSSTRLASASMDFTVKLWDIKSGKCLKTLDGHRKWVTSVAISCDSTRLASASSDRTVKIWDMGSGECLQTIWGHGGSVGSVAFSNDSTWLVSASDDRIVIKWDARSGDILLLFRGHRAEVHSVAVSQDSTRLASASGDGTVKIWDACSRECLQTLEGHTGAVNSVVFSRDSTRWVSASSDYTIKIWDAGIGECTKTLEDHHSEGISLVVFSHDSTRLATAAYDDQVKIWDASSGICIKTLKGHSAPFNLIEFYHDSTRLVSASHDCTIKMWDVRSGECLQTVRSEYGWFTSIAFSHDSTRLAAAVGLQIVGIWNASSGECLQMLDSRSSGWVTSLAFSDDDGQLFSVSNDHTVEIWDTSNGEYLRTLQTHNGLEALSGLVVPPELDATYSTTNHSLELSPNLVWIMSNSEKLLWIPPEYRPVSWMVSENMIGAGTRHGKLWICEIQRNEAAAHPTAV